MDFDDDHLRRMLAGRASRTPSTAVTGVPQSVVGAPQGSPWIARLPLGSIRTAAALIVVALGAIAVTSLGRFSVSSPGLTTRVADGLYQSASPAGVGPVGSKTCVAIRISDESYKRGVVDVWWWTVGPSGCRSSMSGPSPAIATLLPVALPSIEDLPDRTGYKVALELELLPSGSETIEFILDPDRSKASTGQVIATRGAEPFGATLSFDSVAALTVAEPGGTPIPTPRLP